jgi:hypothetical protein
MGMTAPHTKSLDDFFAMGADPIAMSEAPFDITGFGTDHLDMAKTPLDEDEEEEKDEDLDDEDDEDDDLEDDEDEEDDFEDDDEDLEDDEDEDDDEEEKEDLEDDDPKPLRVKTR